MLTSRQYHVVLAMIGAVGIVGAFAYTERDKLLPALFAPTHSSLSEGVHASAEQPTPATGTAPMTAPGSTPSLEPTLISTVADGLDTPWEIRFLPDGDMLVTERAGRLQRIGTKNVVIAVPGVREKGEGGQMGLALHPDFAKNSQLYLSYTTIKGSKAVNRIVRYTFTGDALTDEMILLDDIPASSNHDGGRLAFGPDGKLYATTGDAEVPKNAPNTSSLAGKILRLNEDGSVPSDNPFGNAVWSYGHRNPQGLTWDDRGRLWATEHGRSGALSGFDELNLIEKGKNYGWPDSQGDTMLPGTTGPVRHSSASDTWAPAGIAFWDDSLFFAGLRGSSLYEAKILADGDTSALTAHLRNDYGRLRAVTVGPDGALYAGTSNKDGRGSPKEGDDRILRIERGFFRR